MINLYFTYFIKYIVIVYLYYIQNRYGRNIVYMENVEGIIDEQIKKLSPTEIKQYAAQLIKQKEIAKQRSRANVQKKKENGIKQLAVDLPEQMLNKFKELMQRTNTNKTVLQCNMIMIYEQFLDQQENEQQQRQQQIQQQNNQQHNQQQNQHNNRR